MKKILILLLLFPFSGITQNTVPPFFTNDFSDLADWTTNDILNNGSQDWVIGTAGPVGAFASPMGAIASTTNANGFALYDSDALGVSATNAQDATITYTGTVDCSAYLNININFESSHRKFQDSVFVEVSNDAWLTFERYEVHANQAINDQSANPEFVSVNISSAAGNQASVSFRFHYEGQWDYAWMVDDVSFTETPPHLLDVKSEAFGGWWIGYQSTSDIGTDFTFYPKRQAIAQPYRFESVVFNNGSEDQSNVKMNVEVESSGSNVYTGASAPITIITNTNDTLATVTNFTPTQTGTYNFSYWATSDSFPTTDTTVMSTIVTDTVYGVDYDWASDGANAQGGYFLGKPCGGNVLGNVFDIYAVDTVTSISFHVNESSAFGSDVNVQLYNIDDPTVIDPILLEESDDYQLQASDIDSWVTLKLLNPYPVTAGTAYLAAVKGTITLQDTTMLSSSSNENSSSWLQDNCVATNPNSTHVPGDWYSISADGLLIRMNFGNTYTSTYNCVGGACFDPGNGSGMYSSLAACNNACTPPVPSWDCIGVTCINPGTGTGMYTTQTACFTACGVTASWDCVAGACIDPGNGSGMYTTQTACFTACGVTPSWDCDGQGNCSDPGTGNGIYASLTACMSNCVVVVPTWDCFGGACIDPGNGSGMYTTQTACFTACGVNASWDCVAGACIDPGNGSGMYTTQTACFTACGVTPSWDCDGQGNCSDPGTGNGLYASLTACMSNCNNVSVEEIGLTNFKIFPNPSSDLFNISFNSNKIQNLRVRIINIIGEELVNENLEQFIGEYSKQINLSDNVKGIYFLELETREGIINKKLILQ